MDFVHQIPAEPQVKDSAYSTFADKIQGSDQLQGQMYWREMTPYCEQVAQDIGHASPTTSKMFDLQNEMRLQAAKPIKECTSFIGQQEYQPAVNTWTNMTADIPDNSTQLNTNMEKIVTKAYGGNPENIQYVFYFIIILPQSQNEFREVAYNCLQREMSANGHFYDPNTQTGGQVQQLPVQQAQAQVPYYTVGHAKK